MKSKSTLSSTQGWALVTVVLFTLLILAMSAGLLSWSTTEMRIDVSHKRRLISRNAAESLIEYGAIQAAIQIHGITDFDTSLFDPSKAATTLKNPTAAFLSGSNIDPAQLEIVASVSPPPTVGRFDVLASNPKNAYSSLSGASGRAGKLTLLARATTLPDFLGRRETIYLKKTMTILDGPVLQYAAFYNMDFEVAPGPNLDIYGPVHTNGDIWVSQQASGNHLKFWENVTAFGNFHKGYKVEPLGADGTREKSGDGSIEFITAKKTFVNLKGDWSTWSNVWRDQYMGGTTDQAAEFKKFTNQTYGDTSTPSSLQSFAHQVAIRPLPGQLNNYVPDPDPTDGVIDPTFRNVPRALIERPLLPSDKEYVGPEVEKQKMSRKAGLYIIVNASPLPIPIASRPDGTLIPGGFQPNEYRAYVAIPGGSSYIEVKLPGQPTFGPTNLGHSPPVNAKAPPRPVIIVKPRQMVDMRRYNEKPTVASISAGYNFYAPRSSTNVYQPKVINIIEVDMTALKKAVEMTVNFSNSAMIFPYDSEAPAAAPDSTYIVKPYSDAIYAAKYTPEEATYYSTYRAKIDEFGQNKGSRVGQPVLTADDVIEGMSSIHWDGSVYIESLEADFLRTGTVTVANPRPTPVGSYPDRRDYGHRRSGVRLINARGPIVSANATRLADKSHPCSPGLTLSTNDALYVLGHFNADGAIYSTTANPAQTELDNIETTDKDGNNSSLFKDPALVAGGPLEQPAALVADAITILSQPTYDATQLQISGWSDELSFLTMSASGYTSGWMNTKVSPTNTSDGAVAIAPFIGTPKKSTASNSPMDPLPSGVTDDPTTWANIKTFRAIKWPAAPTEISAGFIVGLTPSAKSPISAAHDGNNSGGLHNLPRFLEAWGSGTNCAIRGSMVVMFESQVAWEPWSLRVYGPPNRLWGFNNMFRNFDFSDDIPATRNIGTAAGDTFSHIDRATYLSERATMWPGYTFPATP